MEMQSQVDKERQAAVERVSRLMEEQFAVERSQFEWGRTLLEKQVVVFSSAACVNTSQCDGEVVCNIAALLNTVSVCRVVPLRLCEVCFSCIGLLCG